MMTRNGSGNAALLRFLARAGVVPGEVAHTAEAELAGQKDGASAIDWLVRNGILSEEELAEALVKELRLPFVNLATV